MKRELQRIAAAAVIISLPIACTTLPPSSHAARSVGSDDALDASGSSASAAPSTQPATFRGGPRVAAGDIASNCFACHGPNGRSPGSIPSLDRLSAEQIVAKMADFKTGARPSTVMGRYATAYPNAEIDAVAE